MIRRNQRFIWWQGLVGFVLLSDCLCSPVKGQITPIPVPERSNTPIPTPLPPIEDVLPSIIPTPTEPSPSTTPEGTVYVERFEFKGNTVFSQEQLAEVTQKFTQRPISYGELTEAATAVTQLYLDQGYYTSGAYLPTQTVTEGVVTLEIVEGSLENIEVTVEGKLNPAYVRDRLKIASQAPLNVPRLVEALQLLQLDPVVAQIQSELTGGTQNGTSILKVKVVTADTFSIKAIMDNGQVPSVGSFRRGVRAYEGNLSGWGDQAYLSYRNTDGSDDLEVNYTIPFNAYNGTLTIGYRTLPSRIIEEPFKVLDISSSYYKYLISLRQPIIQTPNQTLALGLTFDHQRNRTELGILGQGFPLSPGADADGRTFVSTIRFFQDWTQRNQQQVFSVRSEFDFGINAFGTTQAFDANFNPNTLQTEYFLWRGQAQWARLFAPDTLLLLQIDMQFADRPIVPLEQFALGGLGSVEGYRQTLRLTDNGFLARVEFRFPIVQIPEEEMTVQLIPFFNIGTGWNNQRVELYPNTLASLGLGLQWRISDYLNARIDYAIPLIDVDLRKRTWQENGIYFTVEVGF
jgi:hemolysin activation/secretion protein